MEMREDFLREKWEIFVGSYGHLRKNRAFAWMLK